MLIMIFVHVLTFYINVPCLFLFNCYINKYYFCRVFKCLNTMFIIVEKLS